MNDNKNTNRDKISYGAPHEYLCPISQDVMMNPVIAKDGFTYEREAIEKWFETNSTSPLTRASMSRKLLENKTLKILITDWKTKNILTENTGPNMKIIKIEDTAIEFECRDDSNIWDLIYKIYNVTGHIPEQYTFKQIGWYSRDTVVKSIDSSIEVVIKDDEEITIKIMRGTEEETNQKTRIPSYYTVKNLIYLKTYDNFHLNEIWCNLKQCGDNFSTGQLLSSTQRIANLASAQFHIFSNVDPVRRRMKKDKHHLSRLDVVKKLFDSFINRSIAYSFNTAIGLMSFSDKSKVECEMTPYYECFREKVDELTTSGATALYDCLKEASEKLTIWKQGDAKRREARLRIVCLTDGKDTNSTARIKSQVEALLMRQNIILDCIMITDDYDRSLCNISKRTGGYMFKPSSVRFGFDIMELETMITSKNRAATRDNGIIDETSLPPIILPKRELKSRAKKAEDVAGKFNDSTKRVQKELVEISRNPHPDIDVYINDNNINFWKIIFKGPEGTPYMKGTWLAYMEFPSTYPLDPPNIRFVTPIKHCNINNYGRICHSILERNYQSNTKVSLILQCIYGLLLNPDVNDPLDTNLAFLYYEANGQYEAQILDFVNKYASKRREEWRKELI